MRSNLDPYATHKQTFLDPSTISPSKDYYYAERAKEGALATIGTSPERERPAKKINPYDCFRPGEARQSIVQQKTVDAKTSTPQRPSYQEETTPKQQNERKPKSAQKSTRVPNSQITPFKRYKPDHVAR